jgi:hypothetical protein
MRRHTGNVGSSETECPTYPFIQKCTQTFHTSDRLVTHTARANILHEIEVRVVLNVQDVHFENYSAAHVELNRNLDAIESLELEADKMVVTTINAVPVTWKHTTILSIGLCIVIVALICYHCTRARIKVC